MLKAIGFAVVLSLSIAAVGARASDASSCYSIGDPDARAYCLAKARGEPGACYSVQRADLRSQCMAEVRR